MEYDIYELMRGLHDDSVPLPEDRAADLRRIKELRWTEFRQIRTLTARAPSAA